MTAAVGCMYVYVCVWQDAGCRQARARGRQSPAAEMSAPCAAACSMLSTITHVQVPRVPRATHRCMHKGLT